MGSRSHAWETLVSSYIHMTPKILSLSRARSLTRPRSKPLISYDPNFLFAQAGHCTGRMVAKSPTLPSSATETISGLFLSAQCFRRVTVLIYDRRASMCQVSITTFLALHFVSGRAYFLASSSLRCWVFLYFGQTGGTQQIPSSPA